MPHFDKGERSDSKMGQLIENSFVPSLPSVQGLAPWLVVFWTTDRFDNDFLDSLGRFRNMGNEVIVLALCAGLMV
jgi:hypothetical protein